MGAGPEVSGVSRGGGGTRSKKVWDDERGRVANRECVCIQGTSGHAGRGLLGRWGLRQSAVSASSVVGRGAVWGGGS